MTLHKFNCIARLVALSGTFSNIPVAKYYMLSCLRIFLYIYPECYIQKFVIARILRAEPSTLLAEVL